MARFLFIVFLLLPAELYAAQPDQVDLFSSGLKLFVGMAVVIGLMLIFHVLNRKGFKFLESRHAGKIRIVETRQLGGRKALCLVEVEGKRLLLGLGSDRVDLLHSSSAGSFEDELRASEEDKT